MRLEDIDKELEGYKEIISKVEALKKEKKAILKKIKDDNFKTLPFEKQFEEFYCSNKGTKVSDLYQLSLVAPKFKEKFVDDDDLNRYCDYTIESYQEALCAVFDDENRKDHQEDLGYDDEDFAEEMKEIYAIAKELMDNNIRGWKQDW